MAASGQQCCASFLLYVLKWQLTVCFRSLKPIKIGLYMVMFLSIHLYSLHLDAQYGQTWHLLTQLRSGERTGGQPHYCNQPYCPIVRFQSPSSYMVSAEPFLDRSRPMSCKLAQMGSLVQSPSCDCGQRQTMNHIVDTCSLTRRSESTPLRGWWRSHIAGIYIDCSTREMNSVLLQGCPLWAQSM